MVRLERIHLRQRRGGGRDVHRDLLRVVVELHERIRELDRVPAERTTLYGIVKVFEQSQIKRNG